MLVAQGFFNEYRHVTVITQPLINNKYRFCFVYYISSILNNDIVNNFVKHLANVTNFETSSLN